MQRRPPTPYEIGTHARTGLRGPSNREISAWAAQRFEMESAAQAQRQSTPATHRQRLANLVARWNSRLSLWRHGQNDQGDA